MSATTQPLPAAGLKSAEQGHALQKFVRRFTVLNGAPRELWLVFLLKLMMVAAYAVTNKTLALWLSSDIGLNDVRAGNLIQIWALSITTVTLLVGSLTDAIGLRRTFFAGAIVCLIARSVMVFSNVKWLSILGGMFPLALGEALSTPVLIAGLRRFSNTRQRSIAFSLFYAIMNLAFWASSRTFDYLRQHFGEHGQVNLFGLHFSTYRALLCVSLIIEFALIPAIFFIRRGAEATDEGVKITLEPAKYPGVGVWSSFWLTVRDSGRDTIRLFAGLLRQQGFYRLLAFLVFIGFLKVIFMQLDYVFPKFGIRVLGNGAPIGGLSSINYLLIILLVPVIGALTQRFAAYKMVILGGSISAISVFIMALPASWFQPFADGLPGHLIGHKYFGVQGSVHPYYLMIVCYLVLLSVGEAFYSPRVYEYAASIAPRGQEASYAALSYVPFLLGKLIGSSGWLLARYCPEQGERHPATMWLIYALIASMAPVGLLTLRRYIRVQEAGRD
jgi:MFS family permease